MLINSKVSKCIEMTEQKDCVLCRRRMFVKGLLIQFNECTEHITAVAPFLPLLNIFRSFLSPTVSFLISLVFFLFLFFFIFLSQSSFMDDYSCYGYSAKELSFSQQLNRKQMNNVNTPLVGREKINTQIHSRIHLSCLVKSSSR